MPHRPPQPSSPHARSRRAESIQAGMAALAMACLAAACQVAPLGPGLMDGAPSPVVATPSAAPASATPALLPPPVTAAAASTPGPASPGPGVLDLLDRPAERALLAGLRAYDDGQYPEAETQLRRAIEGNLRAARDRSAARKQLAFIYCTTGRMAQCEAEFRAALRDDPSFALSRGEAGHPMWGPVYKRVKPQ